MENLLDHMNRVALLLLDMVEQKQFVHVQWQQRYVIFFVRH